MLRVGELVNIIPGTETYREINDPYSTVKLVLKQELGGEILRLREELEDEGIEFDPELLTQEQRDAYIEFDETQDFPADAYKHWRVTTTYPNGDAIINKMFTYGGREKEVPQFVPAENVGDLERIVEERKKTVAELTKTKLPTVVTRKIADLVSKGGKRKTKKTTKRSKKTRRTKH